MANIDNVAEYKSCLSSWVMYSKPTTKEDVGKMC